MLTIISFVPSNKIVKEFCSENFFFIKSRNKLFRVLILFIFRENIFWLDALREAEG